MQRFYRYFRGTVTIRVTGSSLQRFMNLCSVHRIELKKVQIEEDGAQMEVLLPDLYLLKPILKKTKMRVVLLEKRGLPFAMKKWRKRNGFFGGLLVCFVLIYALSLFVWDISLVGDGQMTKQLLIDFLQDKGVGYGCLTRSVDPEALEKGLREEFPYVVWANVTVSGTRLTVAVKENGQKAEDGAKAGPCDLYATASGTIHSIITRSGLPQVEGGQTVTKGDKLVSGTIPVMNDDDTVRTFLYTHADADIYLDTDFIYEKEAAYRHEIKQYTGEGGCVWYCKLYQSSFSLGSLPREGQYDIVTDLRQAKLFADFYLPLYYGKITYREYQLSSLSYSGEELDQVLEDGFLDFCNSLTEKGIQIIEKNVTIKENRRSKTIRAVVTVRVRDGEEKAIDIGDGSGNGSDA